MSVPTRFRKIVGGGTAAAGAIGVPGAFSFGADVPILLSIWGVGGVMIADAAGHHASASQMKALATSAISGGAAFVAGSKLAGKLFHLLPGPGTMAAIGVNSSLDAFFTYRFLRSVAKVYDQCDSEEMVWQNLQNGIALVSVFSIISDVSDMMDCIGEGAGMASQFNQA